MSGPKCAICITLIQGSERIEEETREMKLRVGETVGKNDFREWHRLGTHEVSVAMSICIRSPQDGPVYTPAWKWRES